MRKITLFALSIAASPAVAQQVQPTRFEHEGVHYEYVVETRANGGRLIKGRNVSDNRRFSLLERDGLVTGTVGSSAVTYRVPARKVAVVTVGAGE